MEDIVLIGGGGHCKACIDVIEAENRFSIEGILDVLCKVGDDLLGYKIIGTDEDMPEFAKRYKNFFITTGQIKSPALRIEKYNQVKALDLKMPVIVSPLAYVSRHSSIGEGSIVMHRAIVNAGARIGNNCIINTGAIIEHDAVIGDHCHISTGAIVNGGAVVGDNAFAGSNAMIREYVKVRRGSVIGGGVSVMKDVSENSIMKADKK